MLLSATGVAGHPQSYFHVASVTAWADALGHAIDPAAPPRAQLEGIFHATKLAGRAGTGLFGLRLQATSLDFFLEQLAILHPDHADDVARITAAFGPTRFIHLHRKSKLDQAVSLLMATQTGLWHAAEDGSEIQRRAPPAEPVYDADKIRDAIAEMEHCDRLWEDWFARAGVAPLRLAYETLAEDPRAVVGQVLAALDRQADLPGALSIPTMRLANATNRDWIARFRAEDAGS